MNISQLSNLSLSELRSLNEAVVNMIKFKRTTEASLKKMEQAEWDSANPEKSALWKEYLAFSLPPLSFEQIPFKAGSPTRNASGAVLEYLSEHIGNMIVMSADLSNRAGASSCTAPIITARAACPSMTRWC